MKRALATVTFIAALAAGCGNYSNEDIDFQLALPVRSDLEARMPMLTHPGAPQYLIDTRNVVLAFNGIVDGLTGLVDYVRSVPPTERSPGRRVWGPFPDDKRPGWQSRMVMSIVAAPGDPGGYHIEYSLDFQRAGVPDAPWTPLLSGKFFPTGGARRGRGDLRLDLMAARRGNYPVNEFNDESNPDVTKRNKLLLLEIAYQRIDFPVTIDVRVTNTSDSATPGAVYHYRQERDRSAAVSFEWLGGDFLVQAVEVRSRWRSDGAGRADALVVAGALTSPVPIGTDCWDQSARPLYEYRGYAPKKEVGMSTNCLVQ